MGPNNPENVKENTISNYKNDKKTTLHLCVTCDVLSVALNHLNTKYLFCKGDRIPCFNGSPRRGVFLRLMMEEKASRYGR